jgi:hypothetical protein
MYLLIFLSQSNDLYILCPAKFCYKDACHVFTSQEMDYDAAEGYCRDIGYNIVKIQSKEKNEYVANVVQSLSMDGEFVMPYIGMYYEKSIEVFQSDGNTTVFTES